MFPYKQEVHDSGSDRRYEFVVGDIVFRAVLTALWNSMRGIHTGYQPARDVIMAYA